MDIQIIEAIKFQHLIEIYYNNELQVVAPHCYGTNKMGKEILIAAPIKGNPNGTEIAWKDFILNQANDINVLLQKFKRSRKDYPVEGKEIEKIWARV